MRRLLLATTALAVVAGGGMASAQGVALFGDARLGLGYNINNDGSLDGDEDLRAVSRVRFGVNMTGETDSGITFGATIRADNAVAGQGGAVGQRAGSVFVSGAWGTLTYGDTNGADEQWVGDVPGNLSLTGLGDLQETIFISNGGEFGNEEGNSFAANPLARPTIRYDFDIAGFGLSLSSNRDLTDVGVGGGYAADFAGGSWSVGAGYYKFESFVDIIDAIDPIEACFDAAVGIIDVPSGAACEAAGGTDVYFPAVAENQRIPAGKQWSAGLAGEYQNLGFGMVYTNIESDDDDTSNLADPLPRRHLRLGRRHGRRLVRQHPQRRGRGDGRRRPRQLRPQRRLRPRRRRLDQRRHRPDLRRRRRRRRRDGRRLRHQDGLLVES